ncbi:MULTISPECIES: MBL fold metallo-hydrolase [unclassified Crossiella]|uniref:MBL fold metallo-hydrolase n=1 Tax=unclassified Crossiella TaxID=2620835 RepID=UPI001FFFCBE3|nr:MULTISPECIES: MBL fold metallo-hydrolase [unclassified Crossiella]MCK2241337.1 MBL fold metallo-hydrolase [Crossiella sp. S99.2]MCK2253519.1 MBL fold metallo-hydrolase [Crossiella sp. S99.1]
MSTQPMLRQIADGVHAYEQLPGGWCLNNAGLIASKGHAVLIDTAATQARARRLRAQTELIVPGGPDLLVNTHFHGDHVFGNTEFTPKATVIAHEQTRADSAEAGLALCGLWPGVEWGELELTLPDVTFQDRLRLHVGELTVELELVGPAHTAGDVIAWVPQRRVLFAGDVVWSGVTPYVLMGSIEGSLRALDRMRALDPAVVVSGHGPVAGPEVLDATEAYLRWVRELAQDGLRTGQSALEVARAADLGPFAALVDPERLVGNLHRAYAELDGLAPGARLDVGASFREMAEFHGGLPHCAA